MRQYILLSCCIFSCLQAMENEKHMNALQEQAISQLLSEANIDFRQKKVLDIGSGTKTTAEKKYNTAIAFFCLHLIKNKKEAIKKTNLALEINGEFFGTHQSISDSTPFHFTSLKEMIPGPAMLCSTLQQTKYAQETDYHIISDDEFKQLLLDNGFELISYESKYFDITISKQELENAIRPAFINRPATNIMPTYLQEWFLNRHINNNLEKLTQKEDGNYLIPAGIRGTKIFHARKVKDI